MTEQLWKIGELAAATGLTVRTLRHFHHIGLLRPAGRSPTGHRLYTGDEVRRLYRILALREAREPSIDQLIEAMEAMMQARHFSPDQFAGLKQRHAEAGEAGLTRWRDRMAELAGRAAVHAERGTDPADPEVQDLAGSGSRPSPG
ncbi:MerR family transcriptional regulator [Nonomuraea thailandensis]